MTWYSKLLTDLAVLAVAIGALAAVGGLLWRRLRVGLFDAVQAVKAGPPPAVAAVISGRPEVPLPVAPAPVPVSGTVSGARDLTGGLRLLRLSGGCGNPGCPTCRGRAGDVECVWLMLDGKQIPLGFLLEDAADQLRGRSPGLAAQLSAAVAVLKQRGGHV